MLDPEGNVPVDNNDPVTEITGLRSPTYPPTSVAHRMQEGNHRDLILQMTTRIQTQTMSSKRGKDKRGKKHPTGSRRPPGGGPGDGDDDDGDGDGNDSDDSDHRFIRRMRAMFGSSRDQSNDKEQGQRSRQCKSASLPPCGIIPKLENPYKGGRNVGID